jgi:predicted transcriptional regulator
LYIVGGPELASNLLKRAAVIRRITVRDFMTQQPLCINQNSNLAIAAKLMSAHRISGLPVQDESGKLTGIISKTDIAQAVAHGKALDRGVTPAQTDPTNIFNSMNSQPSEL